MRRRFAQQDDVTTLKRKPAPQTALPFAELVFVEKRVSRGSALLRKSYAESGFAAVIAVVLRESYALLHICKAFYCFGEALNGLVRITVLNTVSDTMPNMPLQHNFSAAVQSRLRSINLGKNIFARHILIYHSINGLYLHNDFFQTVMQVFRIHTLFHTISSIR